MRKLIKRCLSKSSFLRALSRVSARSVVILRYHSVQDYPDAFAHSIGTGIIHSSNVFREHMRLLSEYYNPVSMDDIAAFLVGRCEMPKSAVAVTFDDGYKDNIEIAAPILREYGIYATFYVVVGSIESNDAPWFVRIRDAFGATKNAVWADKEGKVYDLTKPAEKQQARRQATAYCACTIGDLQRERTAEIEKDLDMQDHLQNADLMLNWNDIRELKKQGHIIGSHSMSHPNLAYVEESDMRKELSDSKCILEKELGVEIHHFAYPNPILKPIWNVHTCNAAKEIGYRTIVTCDNGRVMQNDDPACLRRIVVPDDADELAWYVGNAFIGHSL